MGKSSLIQMILLLLQSDNLEKRIIDLNGTLVQIGQGRDALYQFSNEDFIEFNLCFIDYPEFKWKLNYEKDKDKLTAENGYAKDAMMFFREQTNKFQFISAERIGPQDLYDASSVIVSDKKHIGLSGEYAAYYLNVFGSEYVVNKKIQHNSATSDKLLEQLNAWLGEISPGVRLNTKYVPEINKVILDYQFNLGFGKTNSFKSKNVGFGISYVMPIVLTLLTAERGKTIIIENPESHIHPRGQSELGKLIALSASFGAQLFVETHSDHILNGIRVAVKEDLIAKEDVNISYFDKITTDKEQYSHITQIKIDKQGELSKYPKDFMDEWNNQLLKLV
ncbi:hypothetical protein ES705_39338 [subsurface metagenome]